MILVTGASGTNGAELTRLLSSRGAPLRALVRSRERAREIAVLPGVEIVAGDFDDPGSIARALEGVERARPGP